MGPSPVPLTLESGLLAGAERGVQDHCDVVGGHAVRHRVQRFIEVPPGLFVLVTRGSLAGVPDDLGNLAGRQLLVAGAVGDLVDDGDRRADQVPDVFYDCSAGRRGSTTTRRSGS